MIFALLNILDLLTTHIGGIQNEANPIGQLLIARYGFLGLVAGKALILGWFAVSTSLLKWMQCPLEKPYRDLLGVLYTILVAWNVRYLILR